MHNDQADEIEALLAKRRFRLLLKHNLVLAICVISMIVSIACNLMGGVS